MKGVLQPDLSVSGNTSTRYERPNSGSRRPQRRHPDPSAYGNSRANIFGTQEAPKPSQGSSIAGSTSDTYYSTPEAPRDDGKDEKTKVKEVSIHFCTIQLCVGKWCKHDIVPKTPDNLSVFLEIIGKKWYSQVTKDGNCNRNVAM